MHSGVELSSFQNKEFNTIDKMQLNLWIITVNMLVILFKFIVYLIIFHFEFSYMGQRA